MRNVKLMAKERARTLLEQTVNNIKIQFEREMLVALVEFDHIREQMIRKDKENKKTLIVVNRKKPRIQELMKLKKKSEKLIKKKA